MQPLVAELTPHISEVQEGGCVIAPTMPTMNRMTYDEFSSDAEHSAYSSSRLSRRNSDSPIRDGELEESEEEESEELHESPTAPETSARQQWQHGGKKKGHGMPATSNQRPSTFYNNGAANSGTSTNCRTEQHQLRSGFLWIGVAPAKAQAAVTINSKPKNPPASGASTFPSTTKPTLAIPAI
ncbi:hypothetical protein BGZ80_002186 [Entomortierella chlamydospora]|uniref:Uncharacterized protein n=1 Tax=Entomortierella chlamydospora TaxID=101097 RepID=A0A9P6SXA1_9FUNG|nr:hypothetical protein BGZ80_002186 [Entomortierella chlamydospora]